MSKQSKQRRRSSERYTDVAFNGAAPQAERQDALRELQREHMPTANDLAPMGHLKEFIAMAQEHLTLEKALSHTSVPNPSNAARAGQPGMQSVRNDEFRMNLQGDYWERPSLMTFDNMRAVCDQTPVLAAVLLTRTRQVQRFCAVSESGNDMPGYEIRHMDKDHKITKSEAERIKQLNRFIANCGWEFKPRVRKGMHRDSFSQFMGKAVRDTLSMDSSPIELEWKRDKRLGLDGFYQVDGATTRLCTDAGYQGNRDVRALQVVQGQITAAYTIDDLVYEARNPRSDVLSCGYGNSEVELLVKLVTGYLNAMTYNIKGFDSNAIPKGLLQLVGNYDDKDIAAFKRYWNSMVRGVNNAWSLPVMVAKDGDSKAVFEKFGVEFNEMYFAKWMTFLTSLICAIYGMSPAEINFDSFSGGNSSPLSGSDTSEKLAASKDSGLRPLLAYFQNLMTDFIVGEHSEDLVFRWTGLDPEDSDKREERHRMTMTVDEMRARDGMPAHPDKLIGAAPVNPALIQVYMASQQAAGALPGAEDGQGDEEGQGEDEEGPSDKAGPVGRPRETGGEYDFGKSFGLPVLNVKELLA